MPLAVRPPGAPSNVCCGGRELCLKAGAGDRLHGVDKSPAVERGSCSDRE